MRVDHLSFSRSGGAGVVASQLQRGQAKSGVDSQLFTLLDTDLFHEPFSVPRLTARAALDAYLVNSGEKPTLISLFRSAGSMDTGAVRDDSIIHLHWVEGLVGYSQLKTWLDQGRRVVWTLHDMAPFTGACHHAFECDGYQHSCQNCPQVKSLFRPKVKLNLASKILYQKYKNLKLVAPTNWLAQKARASVALRDQEISVIPNPISEVFFESYDRDKSRLKLGFSANSVVGILVANNLMDPNKRVAQVVEVFNRVSRTSRRQLQLVLAGNKGSKFQASSPAVVSWLGALRPAELAKAASAADFVVSFSQAESAGLTMRECGALRLPSFASAAGGAGEMFTPEQSGFEVNSERSLEVLLTRALSGEVDLNLAGSIARQEAMASHPDKVLLDYQKLYSSFV